VPGELRYNNPMTKGRRYLYVWFSLAIIVIILIAATALWRRGTPPGGDHSPLATHAAAGVSPLPTPTSENETSPPPTSWRNGGVVLLWVALGILLALIIAFVVLSWVHRPT
jgi:hypothetical protein